MVHYNYNCAGNWRYVINIFIIIWTTFYIDDSRVNVDIIVQINYVILIRLICNKGLYNYLSGKIILYIGDNVIIIISWDLRDIEIKEDCNYINLVN